MKLTLKKSNSITKRFFGTDRETNLADIHPHFLLIEEIIKLNSYQKLDSKFYFLINFDSKSLKFKGPYLNVLGPKVTASDDYNVIDLRDVTYFEALLSEDLQELSLDGHFYPQINAIRNKIGDCIMFLSTDFNKIELHIFKK